MTKTSLRQLVVTPLVAFVFFAAAAQADNTALLYVNSNDANNTSTVAGTTVGWEFPALANLTSLGFLHTYPNDPMNLRTDGSYWFNVTGSVFRSEIGNAFPARNNWSVGDGRYGLNFTCEVTSAVPEPTPAALLLVSLVTAVAIWQYRRSTRC